MFVLSLLISTALAGGARDYRIGPGDAVDVVVHGEALSSGGFTVAANGQVSLPCAGMVPLAGRTAHEAEGLVRRALMPGCYVDPQVTVRISEYRSQPIEVLGAVSKPGVYYLDGQTTLRTVITRAGGVKTERSTGQILLTRKGQEPLQVGLSELEASLGDYTLFSGDVITVDEGRIVFVAGEVQKPGEIPFSESLTVSQAYIKAGGSTEVARLAGAYVLRDGDKVPVNLRRILKGKDPDLVLQAGDRLVIPESPI